MGKLLIFVGIVVATVVLLGLWGLFLQKRHDQAKMGLTGSKRRMTDLEEKNARYRTTLVSIQSLADANVGSGVADPTWELVLNKTNAALAEDKADQA